MGGLELDRIKVTNNGSKGEADVHKTNGIDAVMLLLFTRKSWNYLLALSALYIENSHCSDII